MSVVDSIAHHSKVGVNGLIKLYHPRNLREKGILWLTGIALVTLAVLLFILSFYWDIKPVPFDVRVNAMEMADNDKNKLVPGYITSAALVRAVETLLNKPGGYLSNDRMPPGVLMDNMPNWEFGVLVQVRDLARALRNDFARSQTQSLDDKDLQIAEPQFHFNSEAWMFPSTESEYQKGIDAMHSYMTRLAAGQAQFQVRADNLRDYLGTAAKRLGDLTQRLGASVGHPQYTLAQGASQPRQETSAPTQEVVRTPWMEIDDVFYEARGSAWALLHFLKAIEQDFSSILQNKTAQVSLRQVIRELENTQEAMWSPIILNGTGFGFVANHSLVMASYISRANTALVDLRDLLRQG